MSLRVSHSSFQLDLVDTNFNLVEQNNLFTDKNTVKYSFPLRHRLTDEENAALQFISEHFSTNEDTVYNVIFEAFGISYKAEMEIDSIIGREIEFQIRYGLEDFPNYNKRLSELPLYEAQLVGETIYEHAQTKVNLSYPDTDYNFPRIFTQKFDTESEQFEAFQGFINGYSNGAFVENEFDTAINKPYNYNVMQPLPSLMYVLKTGFLDAGFELVGDILEDPEFKNAYIYALSGYYSSIFEGAQDDFFLTTDQFIIERENGGANYETTVILETAGRYRLSGILEMRPFRTSVLNIAPFIKEAFAEFFLNDVSTEAYYVRHNNTTIELDLLIEVYPGQENTVLKFTSSQKSFEVIEGERVDDAFLLDANIIQLFKYDINGNPSPTLITPQEIALKQCVPDITFGQLVETIKIWKNFKISFVNNEVSINYIKDLDNKRDAINLSDKEVQFPERIKNSGKSFELKFQEVESENYKFSSIYFDRDGSRPSPYVKKENTTQLIIDALVLPLKSQDNVITADGFLDDNGRLQLVKYQGIADGVNNTLNFSRLLIPAIFNNHYQSWFNFLISATAYRWSFKALTHLLKSLNEKSTIYAYGKYHIVNKLTKKKNLSVFEVDLETETLD